jgi:hypothetical protein
MAKLITVIALFFLTACTLTIDNGAGIGIIEQEGANSPLFFNYSTNTPTATNTPVFVRTVSILRSDINLRPTPSTVGTPLRQIPQGTVAMVLEERNGWLRIRYGENPIIEGWVLGSLTSNPVTVKATLIAPTPTAEFRLNVPVDGLQGYACRLDVCLRPDLYLSVYDSYQVLWSDSDWAWICVLASDRTSCISQFYVKVG